MSEMKMNLDVSLDSGNKKAVLSARDIVVKFHVRERILTAIRNVSID